MKNTLWFAFSLVAAIILISHPAIAIDKTYSVKPANEKAILYPLIKGWTWEYKNVYEEFDENGKSLAEPWHDKNGPKVKVDRVREVAKTEVTEVTENENFILADITTVITDLDSNKSRTFDSCLVLHKQSGFFWDGPKSLKEDFDSGKLTPPPMPTLILPLKVGQHWGYEDGEFKRDDFWYQWHVEAIENIKVPAGIFNCYRLAFRTNPDHRIIWFNPKVGIVKEEYVHHGTIINEFNDLASYGPKK